MLFPAYALPKLLNEAEAISRSNGQTVFALQFKIRRNYAPGFDAVNRALALADMCDDCDAIAIAVQVVFTQKQNLAAVSADNTAKAINYLCDTSCSALAEAYQIVIANDSAQPTFEQIVATARAQAKFEALRRSGLDNDEIRSQSTDIINQMISVLEGGSGGASADTAPTFSPAVNGSSLPAQLTQNSGPVIDLFHDIQWWQPPSAG